jgi:MtN3 and saliva related transmembrane protein
MTELLGWFSSLVLLTTIISQITRQWREGSGKGVSRWLFAGQSAASLGFTAYSALLHNWVFTLTNGALFISGIVGLLVTVHFKRHPRPRATEGDAKRPARANRRGVELPC